MMAGNPDNLWSMHDGNNQLPSNFPNQASSIFPLQYFNGSSSFLSSDFHSPQASDGQDLPLLWSRLLAGGVATTNQEDHRFFPGHVQTRNWNDDMDSMSISHVADALVKEENSRTSNSCKHEEHKAYAAARASSWPLKFPASSPNPCVTGLSSSINDFSNTSKATQRNQHAEYSSECNSTTTKGVHKKARVQSSSTPLLKVRKEKLGDRIAALHQLVSPFGKTDTASVLLEAIGHIRFLQVQIEALSSPYLGKASEKNQLCPDCMMRDDAPKDLRSRGLCLIPISCTQLVGGDNGGAANYWVAPPSFNGGL